MTITVTPLTGAAVKAALPDLARLRIEVFRDWPYLYDGTYDYERGYIATFAESAGALIVTARDGGRIVGAATAAPLADQAEAVRRPFEAEGRDLSSLFYFGESVLIAGYRGRGIGHAFFDQREAHARRLGGFTAATFCEVVRPEGHPGRPAGYRSLHTFWRKRGYEPVPSLVGSFAWLDIGESEETVKPMQYWMGKL